jgi:CubicO group peptidase (beta-lactamase class C family)
MEWTAVESSQIAEVGFETPNTLGVKFLPNKKQKEAGQPGSEYHYANVDYDLFNALIAAVSHGQFFGENIKKHPELYPYTKIEPEV